MKKFSLITLLFISFSFTFWSCQDVIQIDVKEGVNQLVVDAWLTNEASEQKITLTLSQPYFDNSAPKPALGATVFVFAEDSTKYVFSDFDNDGIYIFNQKENSPIFSQIGRQFALYISYQGDEYYSLSRFLRVPKIDSVSYENFSFPVAINDSTPKDGFLAQFYAKDFEGVGDTYWIRFYKNGKRIIKPNLISIAYDAGFSPGSKSDALLFILPIRQSINDGLLQDKDSVSVELYSISNEAFYFLSQVRQESSNAGIFATPSANIPTNIINLNSASVNKAIGFFCVSNVNKIDFVVDKAKAKPKR